MNTILTDDERRAMMDEWMLGADTLQELLRKVEAAVLAKLREQEPVAWLVTGPYEKRAFTDLSFADASCRGLNKGFGEDAYAVTPLVPYAAPPTADWYCEAHPEHLMGHDGCTGGGIPECARVGQIANQLRLARQEIREIAQHRDDLVAQYRAALAAPLPAVVQVPQIRKARDVDQNCDVVLAADLNISQTGNAVTSQAAECVVCREAHSVLDHDESKIIRDAKDGYPDGRPARTLTLPERIAALCTYAADWKRWCQAAEAPAKEPAAIVKWSGGALAAHIVGDVAEGDLLYRAAPEAPAQRCTNCDDTGDVHDQTGEWRGRCKCPAGQALPAQHTFASAPPRSVSAGRAHRLEADARGEGRTSRVGEHRNDQRV